MAGVIYGYELSSSEGLYYFGRTKSSAVCSLDVAAEGADERSDVNLLQCAFLRRYCKRCGLNGAGKVVLWYKTNNVKRDWHTFIRQLHYDSDCDAGILNLAELGTNWFSRRVAEISFVSYLDAMCDFAVTMSEWIGPNWDRSSIGLGITWNTGEDGSPANKTPLDHSLRPIR